MKNTIIKSLCAASLLLSVASCQDYNEQLEGYNPKPEITDVQNLVITLTDDDYSAIAKNSTNKAIAAENNLSDVLAAAGSEKQFRSKSDAERFLPAFLEDPYTQYLTSGSTALVSYNLAETVVSGGEALILDGGEGFPTESPVGEVTFGEVEFSYSNVFFGQSGSSKDKFTFMKEGVGYLANNAEIEATEVIITESGNYYNLSLYAGETADAVTTAVEYVKTEGEGTKIYTYAIPAGCKFFKVVDEAGYNAYAQSITFKTAAGDIAVAAEGLPTDYPNGDTTINGIQVNYNNAYYSSYGSYTIPAGTNGFISNSTELVDLSRIVITEDYQYYNVTLYVGASVDAVTTEVEYAKEGTDYVYTIPEGNGFFKIVNESSHNAQGDKIAFTCGEPKTEDVITVESSSFCLNNYVWAPKSYLTLTDNTDMSEEASETAATFEVNGVTFEYVSSYYNSTYGSFTVAKESEGYIRNLTEMPGLSKVIVTEDYSYYNLSLYAGTASGAENTLIEYTKDGDEYTYVIPEGHNFIKFANGSEGGAYNASCDAITFEFNGLN